MELQIQFNIASLSISPGLTVQAAPQSTATPRRPSDPLPHAPLPHPPPPRQQPVKAELVTTELDDEPQSTPRQQQQSNGLQQAPPPYHIAAARSKQASTFSALHTNTNGNSYNNSNNAANGTVQNNGKGSGNNVNNTNKKANGGQQVRSCNCSSKINVRDNLSRWRKTRSTITRTKRACDKEKLPVRALVSPWNGRPASSAMAPLTASQSRRLQRPPQVFKRSCGRLTAWGDFPSMGLFLVY